MLSYEMAIAMAENAIANGAELFLEHELLGIALDGKEFILRLAGKSAAAMW